MPLNIPCHAITLSSRVSCLSRLSRLSLSSLSSLALSLPLSLSLFSPRPWIPGSVERYAKLKKANFGGREEKSNLKPMVDTATNSSASVARQRQGRNVSMAMQSRTSAMRGASKSIPLDIARNCGKGGLTR